MTSNRILVLAGGICGAAGVALSAAAAHAGGGNAATAASFLLTHAPAFLAVGLIGGSKLLRGGGFVLLLGLTLFAADLLVRHYGGIRLFPMAAPAGGVLMIIGWLAIAASAFARQTGTI